MSSMSMAHPAAVAVAADRPAAEDLADQALESHMRRMFGLIYRMVGNLHDAQDLTHDAMVKALRHRKQLQDNRKAAQWLNRIAVNTALDFVRRRSRVPFHELDREPPARNAADNPADRVARRERRAWIEQGLRLLSDRERTALLLRDFQELPAREVAAIMGCSPATVRSHISNARVKFRKYKEGQP